MNFLKTILSFLVFFSVYQIMATDSRVQSMGKHDTFFMDDISIFWNPANINIFPNFLMGELGVVDTASKVSSVTDFENFNPSRPWFGGIFSYSMNKDKESESRYPQVTVGAVFNHENALIEMINDSLRAHSKQPMVGTSDFFVGHTTKSGLMSGIHLLYAGQNEGGSPSHVMKLDGGVNMPMTENIDLEVSGGMANLKSQALDPSYDETDFSFYGSVRLFSTMILINGEIVPVFKFNQTKFQDRLDNTRVSGGVGANVSLDKGFFWTGFELGYSNEDVSNNKSTEATFSFGIERNVWWDWFVLRVGGRQTLFFRDNDGNKYWDMTNKSNGTNNDLVGLGVGLNIEEKLKIDGVVAEDIPYTFGNLFSGAAHHLMTRITATYSF